MREIRYSATGDDLLILVEEWGSNFYVVSLTIGVFVSDSMTYYDEIRIVGTYDDRDKAIEFGVKLGQMDKAELLLVTYLPYK